MTWNAQKQLLWKLGDMATETGAPLVNWTTGAGAQKWFDATTTPLTAGQMTGGSGTIPIASWFEIDTRNCDNLYIVWAAKTTAVGTQTAAVSSTVRPTALGMPYFDASIPAWTKPAVTRVASGTSANDKDGHRLACYGPAAVSGNSGGMSLGEGSIDIADNVFAQSDGTNPVAGDYLGFWFEIGHRLSALSDITGASPIGYSRTSIRGITRVWLTMLTLDTATAGGGPSMSLCGELYAIRTWDHGIDSR